MARTAAVTTVSPIVAALIAQRTPMTKSTLSDKLLSVASTVATDTTKFAGQLVESFDGRFYDTGVVRQKLLNESKLQQEWARIQREFGLSDADVAALLQ